MGGQSDGTIVLWFLAAGFLVTALAFPAMLAWYVNRLSPEAISRRLLSGCPAIRRPTKWLKPAWDPSQPRGRGMWTKDGPGMATYTLTPDRLIRLELVRDDGRREERIGPPLSRRTASAWDALIWLPPLAYLSSAIIGALVGYSLADGSSQQRWRGSAVGLMLAVMAAYIVLTVIGRILRARRVEPRA